MKKGSVRAKRGTNQHNSPYTPEFKSKVVALAMEKNSYADASREFGVTVERVRAWCIRAGQPIRAGKTTEGLEVRAARLAQQRARVQEQFLNNALLLQERITEQISLGGIERSDGMLVKDLMISAAISMDKYRLEMGEVTSRESLVDEREAATSLGSRLDELAIRREARKSARG